MKLTIYTPSYWPKIGGLETISQIIATECAGLECDVTVLTDDLLLNTDARAEENNVKIVRTKYFKSMLSTFSESDVILFMNISLKILPIAIASRKPIVLSHHIDYSDKKLKNKILSFVKRTITIFFSNIYVSSYISKKMFGRGCIIPNAYDSNIFYQENNIIKKVDFVFCGRIVSDKGVNILIEAFQELLQKFPCATLLIIGDGEEKNRLEKLTQKLNLQKNIIFAGILQGKELGNRLRECRCMVVPSLWKEPFGIVALEGLACCDYVIATDQGGLPEALGGLGLLSKPDKDDLAMKMLSVMAYINDESNENIIEKNLVKEKKEKFLIKHHPKKVAQDYLNFCFSKVKR